ncbi:MAG: hypothetical protein Q4F22_04815 [Phascolarctobacterium sp.]|nr:hypothetical protein [Phascolarctobacterium sp.]
MFNEKVFVNYKNNVISNNNIEKSQLEVSNKEFMEKLDRGFEQIKSNDLKKHELIEE